MTQKKQLEFGVDRLPENEATCAAWPALKTVQARKTSAHNRFIHPKPVPIGAAERPITEEQREAAHRRWAQGFKRTPEYQQALADGRIRLKPTDDEQAPA